MADLPEPQRPVSIGLGSWGSGTRQSYSKLSYSALSFPNISRSVMRVPLAIGAATRVGSGIRGVPCSAIVRNCCSLCNLFSGWGQLQVADMWLRGAWGRKYHISPKHSCQVSVEGQARETERRHEWPSRRRRLGRLANPSPRGPQLVKVLPKVPEGTAETRATATQRAASYVARIHVSFTHPPGILRKSMPVQVV